MRYYNLGPSQNDQGLATRNIRHLRCHRRCTRRTRQSSKLFLDDRCWIQQECFLCHFDGVSRGTVSFFFVFKHRSHSNSSPFVRYTANRQPGKALPFYLRLRRSNVFDLIRENNLFTDVQDQVLLLVEFDHELMEKRKAEGIEGDNLESEAIKLLVNNTHSIPVRLPFSFFCMLILNAYVFVCVGR